MDKTHKEHLWDLYKQAYKDGRTVDALDVLDVIYSLEDEGKTTLPCQVRAICSGGRWIGYPPGTVLYL